MKIFQKCSATADKIEGWANYTIWIIVCTGSKRLYVFPPHRVPPFPQTNHISLSPSLFFPIPVNTALTKTLTCSSTLGLHALNAATRFMTYQTLKFHVEEKRGFVGEKWKTLGEKSIFIKIQKVFSYVWQGPDDSFSLMTMFTFANDDVW